MFPSCPAAASGVRQKLQARLETSHPAEHPGLAALPLVTELLQVVPTGTGAGSGLSSVPDLAAGSNPGVGTAGMLRGARVVSRGCRNVNLLENLVQHLLSFPLEDYHLVNRASQQSFAVVL